MTNPFINTFKNLRNRNFGDDYDKNTLTRWQLSTTWEVIRQIRRRHPLFECHFDMSLFQKDDFYSWCPLFSLTDYNNSKKLPIELDEDGEPECYSLFYDIDLIVTNKESIMLVHCDFCHHITEILKESDNISEILDLFFDLAKQFGYHKC